MLIFPVTEAGIAEGDWLSNFAYQNTPISDVFSLLTFIPSVAVTARRLHDIDRTGWWQISPLIPLIILGIGAGLAYYETSGGVALMVLGGLGTIAIVFFLIAWTIKDSQKEDNRFGSSPKYGGQARAFD